MQRRHILLLVCLLVLAAAVFWRWSPIGSGTRARHGTGITAPPGSPNVLLISLDTLRPDHLGCYGYARPTTPNLDRFAQTAIRFSQVRSQAPWTLASHMSLFTSMLPSNNGVDSPFVTLDPQVPTFVQTLHDAGYRTAAIVHEGNLDKSWGFARGYDTYEEHDTWEATGNLNGRAEVITDRALDWLDHAPKTPWHLFLHYFDAHHPYWSPEPFHSRFGALPVEQTVPLIFNHRRPGEDFANPHDLVDLVNSYDAAIAYLDDQLGRVLQRIPPNTLVVIFSDHGEAFKEHGWTWHGSTVYEEEIRTILMIRPPQPAQAPPPSPRVVDDPVMLLDVAPTILAQCGLTPPPTFEGTDLSGAMRGEKLPERPIASENKSETACLISKCLVLPPWKYIYNLVSGTEELYRLPDEQHNLIATQPPIAQSLREPMRRWVSQSKFWLVYFTGDADFTGAINVGNGRIAALVPILDGGTLQGGFPPGAEAKNSPWRFHAHPNGKVQAIYLETIPPDAAMVAHLEMDGTITPDEVFVGKSNTHPVTVPQEYSLASATVPASSGVPAVSLAASEFLPPFMEAPFRPDKPGFYIRRFGIPSAADNANGTSPKRVPMIDQKTLDHLRSGHYLE